MRRPHTTAPHRRPLVWLLVAALVCYGFSSSLLQLLGPVHRHTGGHASRGVAQLAVAARDLVGAVHAWQERVRSSLPLTGTLHARAQAHATDAAHGHSHPHDDAEPGTGAGAKAGVGADAFADTNAGADHAHDHADFVRHHHAAGDSSVVALDAHAEEPAGSASAGSAMLTLAMAPLIGLPVGQPVGECWPAGPCAAWADALLPAIEHPPRT